MSEKDEEQSSWGTSKNKTPSNLNNPPKLYRPFCAQHLYGTFPKHYLLRVQLTVSSTTKLRTLSTMRWLF